MNDGAWARVQEAAEAVVSELSVRAPLDLWMVTEVHGSEQRILAAAGPWASDLDLSVALPWLSSPDLHMAAGTAPRVAPRMRDIPAYAALAQGRWELVAGYVGVPVLDGEYELFGTLTGVTSTPDDPTLADVATLVDLLGRSLSTVVTARLAEASADAALTASRLLAHIDALTGLLNRRGWQSALAVEHQRMRSRREPASVLVIDLDDLKAINDRQGHDSGDHLLRRTAQVLVDVCGTGDVLARTGGDEFCILLANTDEPHCQSVVDDLASAMQSAMISASIGGSTVDRHDGLMVATARADAAMYDDKRARAVRRGGAGHISEG